MDRRIVMTWTWALAMGATVALGRLLAPTLPAVPPGVVDLAETIPKSFGEWTFVPSATTQVDLAVRRDEQDGSAQVYDEVLMRTYRNPQGQTVMLALAWGRLQRQEVKIHRPELCYVAQGFRIESNRPLDALGDGSVEGRTMLAVSARRTEPVVYWVRIGDTVSRSAWDTRWHILREGIAGRIPDGILVRTSQVVRSPQQADASVALQQRFLADLVGALPPAQRALLVPTDPQRVALAGER